MTSEVRSQKGIVASSLLSLLNHLLWGELAAKYEDTKAAAGKGPQGKELRPPADRRVSEPF